MADNPAGLTELSWLLEISAEELADLLPDPVWLLPESFAAPADGGGVSWWLAAGDQVLVVVGVGIDRVPVGCRRFAGTARSRWSSWTRSTRSTWLIATSMPSAGFEPGHDCDHNSTVDVPGLWPLHDRVSPEWMFDEEICQGCAQDDGVVF
jgi:hypothetical protein